MDVSDASDSRLALLTRWVTDDLGFTGSRIEPASVDASFRRYFRLTRGTDTYIVMDAPPDKETLAPFVDVAKMLAGIGLNVPIVLARDMQQGLLLLSDLGTRQYLDELAAEREVDRLYADAMTALVRMQTGGGTAARALPPYDRTLLLREMQLMPEWFLSRHLGLQTNDAERAMLDRLFEALVQNALAQPRTFVHRDYHSRNLLVSEDANPGILDFQDAVYGAVTYDLVSLLKDCYIAWPLERVNNWVLRYREQLLAPDSPLAPMSASSFAGSISWACSDTSRCSAYSRDCTIATASPVTSRICRVYWPTPRLRRRCTRKRRRLRTTSPHASIRNFAPPRRALARHDDCGARATTRRDDPGRRAR